MVLIMLHLKAQHVMYTVPKTPYAFSYLPFTRTPKLTFIFVFIGRKIDIQITSIVKIDSLELKHSSTITIISQK